MRVLLIVLVFVFVAAGVAFGALNSESIDLDLYFVHLRAAKGALLLGALLAGWLIGGIVAYCGSVPRLRRRLRAANRHAATRDAEARLSHDASRS